MKKNTKRLKKQLIETFSAIIVKRSKSELKKRQEVKSRTIANNKKFIADRAILQEQWGIHSHSDENAFFANSNERDIIQYSKECQNLRNKYGYDFMVGGKPIVSPVSFEVDHNIPPKYIKLIITAEAIKEDAEQMLKEVWVIKDRVLGKQEIPLTYGSISDKRIKKSKGIKKLHRWIWDMFHKQRRDGIPRNVIVRRILNKLEADRREGKPITYIESEKYIEKLVDLPRP